MEKVLLVVCLTLVVVCMNLELMILKGLVMLVADILHGMQCRLDGRVFPVGACSAWLCSAIAALRGANASGLERRCPEVLAQ
mmetsp:Transcript_40608/g.105026  ORF Transcript_40608/g.105026 Transcript_40608/m.105026 type:complete len:82 (+) Transcript_40608:61-306(+)